MHGLQLARPADPGPMRRMKLKGIWTVLVRGTPVPRIVELRCREHRSEAGSACRATELSYCSAGEESTVLRRAQEGVKQRTNATRVHNFLTDQCQATGNGVHNERARLGVGSRGKLD